jgi:hypothetical protein
MASLTRVNGVISVSYCPCSGNRMRSGPISIVGITGAVHGGDVADGVLE